MDSIAEITSDEAVEPQSPLGVKVELNTSKQGTDVLLGESLQSRVEWKGIHWLQGWDWIGVG